MQPAFSSYLGYPRIHFAGYFRADSDTRNNDRCNYRTDKPINPDTNADWGFNGTNEFQFFDTAVTAVVDSTGSLNTKDAIVNLPIVGNIKRQRAKLTDMDVECQDHSTIYGMNFGIGLNEDFPSSESDTALYGNWTPNVIAQKMWYRLKCYNDNHDNNQLPQDSFPFGAQSTTTLTEVLWNSDILNESPVLRELHELSSGKLSVRISLYLYTRNYPPFVALNATLGYVYGVIGAPSPDDTLNVPGSRSMSPTGNIPNVTYNDPTDLCYRQNLSEFYTWTNEAPFEVDETNMKLHVDLSNSIPSDIYNNVRYIGVLRLGILNDDGCVILLGDEAGIPYYSNDALPITSAIYSFDISSNLTKVLSNSSVVIVQMVEGTDKSTTPVCKSLHPDNHHVIILLQEAPYFIRPYGYYVNRLDNMTQPSVTQTLYVTRYGSPANGVNITITRLPKLPSNGVAAESTVLSGSNGFAKITFSLSATIPFPREYPEDAPPCNSSTTHLPDNRTTLPIDGQVYYFTFCLTDHPSACTPTMSSITYVFLAFSDLSYSETPTWVDDVEPILTQFKRMAPIMDTILDMSSYKDVTQHQNIELLALSLRIPASDPGFMPTTRDLSPVKRQMILRWLKQDPPMYDSQSSTPPTEVVECKEPNMIEARRTKKVPPYPRCGGAKLPYTELPEEREAFFRELKNPDAEGSNIRTRAARQLLQRSRPLFGNSRRNNGKRLNRRRTADICTLPNLRTQLQTAIQLEWATIPTYMTSLYSIAEGCNREIYSLVRSIIIQEMLHMSLAGNILMAIGGNPIIDSADVVASYPTHLPGGVLPALSVSLKKLSIQHVHDVFMAIELPTYTKVAGEINASSLLTIGAFYDEISDCIRELDDRGENIFTGDLSNQIYWPWQMSNSTGKLFSVYNVETALAAIVQIKTQGEGADSVNPDQIRTGTIAHFFKFEEVVCENHLVDEGNDVYSYSGEAINFNSGGVWPMRDNPSSCGILPETNCYTESKVFHQLYRAFLNRLQRVFSGFPYEINKAVEMMEALQVHSKKLMWTRYRPENEEDLTTCGPVFDYEWRDEYDLECFTPY